MPDEKKSIPYPEMPSANEKPTPPERPNSFLLGNTMTTDDLSKPIINPAATTPSSVSTSPGTPVVPQIAVVVATIIVGLAGLIIGLPAVGVAIPGAIISICGVIVSIGTALGVASPGIRKKE